MELYDGRAQTFVDVVAASARGGRHELFAGVVARDKGQDQ